MNKSLKNPVILNRYIQFHGKQTADILDVSKPQWELDFEETIPRIKFHPEVSEVSMREQAIDHLTNFQRNSHALKANSLPTSHEFFHCIFVHLFSLFKSPVTDTFSSNRVVAAAEC